MQVHLERRPCADDVNEDSLGRLAFQTQQFVGASLANLVNIAALNAGGAGRDTICYADLEQARPSPQSSSLLGPARASTLPSSVADIISIFCRASVCTSTCWCAHTSDPTPPPPPPRGALCPPKHIISHAIHQGLAGWLPGREEYGSLLHGLLNRPEQAETVPPTQNCKL